jgi:tetratricopeptide (TPR) repeat protein
MPSQFSSRFAVIVIVTFATSQVFAVDVIRRKSDGKAVSGTIQENKKDGLTIVPSIGAKTPVKIPANDITSVVWTGEPATLNAARGQENNGNFSLAVDSYAKAADAAKTPSPGLKADLEFMPARATAKLAVADPTKLDDAIKLLNAFKSKNGDNYNFYECIQLLGELQLAKKDTAGAKVNFELLEKAPWNETKIAAKTALGRILLAEGKTAEALAAFDAVASAPADNDAEKVRQLEALVGKSRCLIATNQHADALKVLNDVITKAPEDDARVQAEAYLRQGDCLLAQGKDKEALLAYLHVDVLFESEQAAHAESLFRLAGLWAKTGRPDRANEARGRLESDYPNTEWAAKVKSAEPAGEKSGG